MMDAARETRCHLGHGIFAVDIDKVCEGNEQRGIGQHFRLNALVKRIFPSIKEIAERGLLLDLAIVALSFCQEFRAHALSAFLRCERV